MLSDALFLCSSLPRHVSTSYQQIPSHCLLPYDSSNDSNCWIFCRRCCLFVFSFLGESKLNPEKSNKIRIKRNAACSHPQRQALTLLEQHGNTMTSILSPLPLYHSAPPPIADWTAVYICFLTSGGDLATVRFGFRNFIWRICTVVLVGFACNFMLGEEKNDSVT